jgi:tetratricopeptide (TPR) repeat protein
MAAVVGSIAAFQLYQNHTRPFDLTGFLDLVTEKGYTSSNLKPYFDWTVASEPWLQRYDLHLNEQYRRPTKFTSVYGYLLDTEKILADPSFPRSWKQHTRRYFVCNGAAFYIERVFVMDGSNWWTRRPNRSARSNTLKSGSQGLVSTLVHELAHLQPEGEEPSAAAVREYEIGTQALEGGNLALAEKHLRRAVKEFPWFTQALDHLGMSLRRQGRYDEAIESYERSLDIERKDVASQNLMMALLYKPDLARGYSMAQKLDRQGTAEGAYWVGRILFHVREYAEASEALSRARDRFMRQDASAGLVLEAGMFAWLAEMRAGKGGDDLEAAQGELRASCARFPVECASYSASLRSSDVFLPPGDPEFGWPHMEAKDEVPAVPR